MRAITAPELVQLRSNGQWSRLFVAGLEAPPVVFAAQINQAFATAASKDQVLQITFDNVTTGAYGDIIPGMTVWIGSAAGLHDIGMARARKAATSTILYIGEESELELANDQFITVVDEFSLWPKHTYISGGTTYMDGDVAYSDEHENFAPVPVMGSDAVLDVAAYPVTLALDGSDSWVPGGTITDYLWTKTAGTLDSSTSATPTLTVSSYPTNGLIRVALRVTASNGEQSTGYRYVRVYDSTHLPSLAQVASIEGSFEAGGWMCEITMYDDVSAVRDRSPVVIFARDYYAGVLDNIGQQAGRENIVCSGWVDGETIEWDAEAGLVRFTVKGAQFWLDKMPGFPPKIAEQASATGSWDAIPSLTVDRALWHLLYWHSTAMMVMDVLLTGDTLYADEFDLPTQSLWAQMKEIAKTILAVPGCDPYNRLFVEVEPQCVPEADRTWTEVMTITTNDWAGRVGIVRRLVGDLSMLELSGRAINAPNTLPVPYYSLSVGHVFARFGGIETIDNLFLDDQAQSNELAGLVMGKRNNPWPNFEISFAQNNRMFTLFPRQYANLTMQTTDNIRGIEFDGRIIPRVVSMQWEAEGGILTPNVTFEAESFAMNSVDGEPPANNPIPPTPPAPPPPPPPPPPGGGGTEEDGPPNCVIATSDFGLLYTLNLNEDTPQWFFMSSGLTTDEKNNVIQIQKLSSGLLLVSVKYVSSPDTLKSIYMAYIGGAWSLLFDDSMVDQGTYGTAALCAFGADPDTGLMMIVGGGYSALNVGTKKTYAGSVGGFSQVDGDLDITNEPAGLSYGMGQWLLTRSRASALAPSGWSRFSSAGAIDTEGDFTTSHIHQGRMFHHREAGNVYCLDSNLGEYLRVIAGNDPTTEVLHTLPHGFGTYACSVCVSPSGSFLMGGSGGVIGQRSSDGGATWGNIGTAGGMSTGYDVWGNCGDDAQFVAATSAKVMLTLDWGDNWIDKSGNLPYLVPGCDIKQIKAWY